MIVIRNVFHCKPGQAKALADKFKATIPAMKSATGVVNARVMTDLSSTFWTVIFETEAESLEAWEKHFAAYSTRPEVRSAMEGYMELVTGGHREIFRVE